MGCMLFRRGRLVTREPGWDPKTGEEHTDD